MHLKCQIIHNGHTSFVVHTGGRTVLIDPMMFSRIKRPRTDVLLRPTIDFGQSVDDVFISHAHTDHFHLPTLLLLNRDAHVYIYGGRKNDSRMERKVKQLTDQLGELGYAKHDILYEDSVVDLGALKVEPISVPDSIDELAQCAFLLDFGFAKVLDGVDMLLDRSVAQQIADRDVSLAFLPSGYSQQSSAGRNQMTPLDAFKFAKLANLRAVAPCGGSISVHETWPDRPNSIASYPTGTGHWISAMASLGIASSEPVTPSVFNFYEVPGTPARVTQEVRIQNRLPSWRGLAALYFAGYDLEDVVEPIQWLTANVDAIQGAQQHLRAAVPLLERAFEDLSRSAAPGINRSRFGQMAPRTTTHLYERGEHSRIAKCICATPDFLSNKTEWVDRCFAAWRWTLEQAEHSDQELFNKLEEDLDWAQVGLNQSLVTAAFPREPWIKDQVADNFRISIENEDLELGVRVLVNEAARLIVHRSVKHAELLDSDLVFPSRRGVVVMRLDPVLTRILLLCHEFALSEAIRLAADEFDCEADQLAGKTITTINRLLEASTFTLELRPPALLDSSGSASLKGGASFERSAIQAPEES
ncbi:MBL fold metallo-hydrolase [Nitrosospira briensis]|uniref:MBL fold metallo-hydrolase n=1 Tax=Nitrosospira briensis TaxID=35799 RepID=UPI0008F26E63|nr:MBL fold metallo-hydrolase [Nitrosospira briensis]SFN67451.1 L-ascorbate metabolism protein UlaG, beta-lactamase superfamily [Nitrosospira briensis]